jgi:diguanylate cyclase (GGDEF)-like protein/PAS domain S-box-containing protein
VHASPDLNDPAPRDELAAWRGRLLDHVVGVTVLVCVLPCVLLTVEAWGGGSWTHAAFCWIGTAVFGVVSLRSGLSPAVRALVGTTMMYGFGLWLLSRGSAVGMLSLLAFPVMTVLVVGLRAGLLALAAATVTLIGVGWLLQLPFPMTSGLAGDSALRWVVIGSNLLLLGLLLCLSAGYLLHQFAQALASRRSSEGLLREVASQIPGMVFRLRLDEGWKPSFLFVSPGAMDVLGVPAESLMADARGLIERLHPDDAHQIVALRRAVRAGQTRHELEVRAIFPGGATRWLQLQATEVQREGRRIVLNGVITDITARKLAEETVTRQAHMDLLTGVLNRLALQIELDKALREAHQDGVQLGMLILDLDRFKEVNDTQGHAGGDELLAQAARRLLGCVRDGDFVARVGGDEFVLLLPRLESTEDAEIVGQRVLAAMDRVFTVLGQQAHVSASIGVAVYPHDGRRAEELMQRADQALYQAKALGRNRLCRYTPALHERAQRRMRLAHELRQAIDQGQLSLVYQPVVDLASGHVGKAEALLRWDHPEFGAVSPAEFIPIAEATGLVQAISDWVLEAAARQAVDWRRRLQPDLRLSINQSPLQFRAEAAPVPGWAERLAALGVPGEALIVEITEGLLLDKDDAVARQLRELRAAGVQVALDDFGTGYSALAYLHRYEIDLLKLDRSFVSGSASGHTGRALCRAIMTLARELGIQVVAEGVETTEQRDWLRGIGCQHAQGWLYARGMPAAEFEAWFRQRQHAAALAEPA